MPLIPPGDVDALASQLRAFLADPKPFLRRAVELQKYVAQHFSVEAMTRDVVDFYISDLGAGIHKLPEHVRFPHNMHVNAGLECQTCHGPVQEMEEVYRFSSLQMGWCIDCHRGATELSAQEEAAVRERSSFVRKFTQLASAGEDLGGFTGTYPDQRASTDCVVCHY